MTPSVPHYLLRSETGRAIGSGDWRFVLRPVDGSAEIAVADVEPDVSGERLDLLTVVRALESLDQPSQVTLLGCTRYVEQGVLYGLAEWKENGWCWEYFGQMTPVRDADLWQRMDRALEYHRVDCGPRKRQDEGHAALQGPHWIWNQDENPSRPSAGRRLATCVKCCALALTVWWGVFGEIAAWVAQKAVATGVRGHGLGARG